MSEYINYRLRKRISNAGQNVIADVENFPQKFYQGEISLRAQNRLEFMHFVSQHVEEITKPQEDFIENPHQHIKALGRLRGITKESPVNKERPKDFFDLEKSERAYRWLYQVKRAEPLSWENYWFFDDARNSQNEQNIRDPDMQDWIENEELEVFRQNVSIILQEGISDIKNNAKDYGNGQKYFKNMLTRIGWQTGELYDIAKRELWEEKRWRICLVYGYTAYAVSHLINDKHLPLEKRSFTLEQSKRALQFLVDQ